MLPALGDMAAASKEKETEGAESRRGRRDGTGFRPGGGEVSRGGGREGRRKEG